MYYEAYDIDWFFLDKNDLIGFIASGGGRVPLHIENTDNYNLREYFNLAPNIDQNVEIHKNIKSILGANNKELNNFFSDFVFIAKKGIYCFDKTILNDFSDTSYHKVIEPNNILKLKSLPTNIQEELNMLKLDIDIKRNDRIDIENLLF